MRKGRWSATDRRSDKLLQPRAMETSQASHIKGDLYVVDISLACIENALEATIEVFISEVHNSFSVPLRSFFAFGRRMSMRSSSFMAPLIGPVG